MAQGMNAYYKHFHLVPGAPISPVPPTQAGLPDQVGENDRLIDTQAAVLYARAHDRSHILMNHLHKKYAKGTGCKLLQPEDTDTPNYPVKDLSMLPDKARRKYNNDISRITDPLRFRITFETYNQYNRISNKFLPDRNPNVLEYEPGIRFDLDKGGFAADQIVIRDPESGLCYEVQIMHDAHHRQNRRTHEAYERQRAAEKRSSELATHWRSAAKAAAKRNTLNEKANQQANVEDMRYTASFGLTHERVPFAAIWPCRYDDPLMTGAKYALTPSLANRTLIHDRQLKTWLDQMLVEEGIDQIKELPDKYAFMQACENHVRKHASQPRLSYSKDPKPKP